MYTHRKFDSQNGLLSQKEALRESNFKRCIHIGNLIPKTAISSQKAALRNQISRGMVEGECIHIGNLIPKTALSSQKAALRESNFLCVYILLLPYLLKFDSRKAAFWLEMAVLGIKFPMCIHLLKFDSRKASFWLKRPFWESNFLCVYILLLPYLLKFDSRKAAFWLEMAVLGIKFPMCIHSPSTIPLEISFP